jgi:hypothetical protein
MENPPFLDDMPFFKPPFITDCPLPCLPGNHRNEKKNIWVSRLQQLTIGACWQSAPYAPQSVALGDVSRTRKVALNWSKKDTP